MLYLLSIKLLHNIINQHADIKYPETILS